MVRIGNNQWPVDHNIAAALGVIAYESVDKDIGAWIGIITTADL